MRALIVEPSLSFRKLLVSSLSAHGFNPIEKESGKEATDFVHTKPVDLMVISGQLPDIETTRFIRELHGTNGLQQVPIFIFTSSTDKSQKATYVEAGATELFQRQDFLLFDQAINQTVNAITAKQSIGGKILYVEDDKATALMTIEVLKGAGYDVTHKLTQDDAFNEFTNNDYHLVLSDVMLNGELLGLSLVRRIRNVNRPEKSRIPIVALSADGNDARRVQLFKTGISDYVNKPVLPEELLSRVANQIRSEKLLQKLEIQQAQLENLAMKDQLTGLYNRHYLVATVEDCILEAKSSHGNLSVIVLDIDHFKQVNDLHGHSIGDQVLLEVGELLSSESSDFVIATRYGGEEFVLLMKECDGQSAAKKAEKIRVEIENLKPADLFVTASFGVASLSDDIEDFTSLFCKADEAVYAAKDQGRNCVRSYGI